MQQTNAPLGLSRLRMQSLGGWGSRKQDTGNWPLVISHSVACQMPAISPDELCRIGRILEIEYWKLDPLTFAFILCPFALFEL